MKTGHKIRPSKRRFQEHCRAMNYELNKNRPLYKAMAKYGIEHFHIELLEETDNPEEREIYWIKEKDSFYNIAPLTEIKIIDIFTKNNDKVFSHKRLNNQGAKIQKIWASS